MSMSPRNVKTNKEYRAAAMRAVHRARARLVKAHPLEYQRFLKEERMKQGLGYIRLPKPRTPW